MGHGDIASMKRGGGSGGERGVGKTNGKWRKKKRPRLNPRGGRGD